jgi:TetR/AcrR family transcriptional regulator, repressor for neighboring sulfatase
MTRTRKAFAGRLAEALPRRRRSPELARQEILDAAERVFAHFQPDQVGLKEVAREAGVSHALITHYFGTYAGLLEAALQRRTRALHEATLTRLREPEALERPADLLELLFRTLQDPVHLRLMRWMLASERPAASHAFALQERGLAVLADQIVRALGPEPDPALLRNVEITLLTAVSAAYGYALAKHTLAPALGREPSPELDDEVRHTLATMVQTQIRPR